MLTGVVAFCILWFSGGSSESTLPVLPSAHSPEPAGSVQRLPGVGGSEGEEDGGFVAGDGGYSVPVYGVATDGTVIPSTPVPAPTPEPTLEPTPEPVQIVLSIPDIICSFSWPCWEAVDKATCESGLNPYAVNPTSGAQGLFQLMPQYHSHRYNGGAWYDPWVNSRAAHSLWLEQGWYPWVC